MASTDKPDPEHAKPESSSYAPTAEDYSKIDVAIRVLIFASTVTAIVVLVTSKQSVHYPLYKVAKFNHSPAFM